MVRENLPILTIPLSEYPCCKTHGKYRCHRRSSSQWWPWLTFFKATYVQTPTSSYTCIHIYIYIYIYIYMWLYIYIYVIIHDIYIYVIIHDIYIYVIIHYIYNYIYIYIYSRPSKYPTKKVFSPMIIAMYSYSLVLEVLPLVFPWQVTNALRRWQVPHCSFARRGINNLMGT